MLSQITSKGPYFFNSFFTLVGQMFAIESILLYYMGQLQPCTYALFRGSFFKKLNLGISKNLTTAKSLKVGF